jgi:hypothetical protein
MAPAEMAGRLAFLLSNERHYVAVAAPVPHDRLIL